MTGSEVGQLAPTLLGGTLHGEPRRLLRGLLLRTVGPILRLRICGEERVPVEGPLLVVSNHLSNADPPLLQLASPRPIFFMAKSELFRIAPVAWVMRRFGAFPVERGAPDRRALRHAQDVLGQGIAMGIFPEGGRSTTMAMRRGLAGAGLLALSSGAPILPVAIHGTEFYPVNGEMPPRRPRDIPRGVTVYFGHPFAIPERIDGRRVTPEEATDVMMRRVAELLPEPYRGVYAERIEAEDSPSVVKFENGAKE
jgi:1-acyl-sn-glycerol-3-phosphate acyltransferase